MKRTEDFLLDLSDLVLSYILIGVTFPVFVIAGFLVKIDSCGPVFYSQKRYGKHEKIFTIYKFRTMKLGAEREAPVWGRESDPRSSKIGKFFRVSHIDELPQLFNVLKGEMSLVGPRPERPYFADKFKRSIPGYEERHKIKPGITGFSQINGLRANSSVEERMQYDRFYVRNKSFIFYIKIILLTPLAKRVKAEEVPVHREYKPSYSRVFFQVGKVPAENIPLTVPASNA